tara:strand:+ start:1730 stop:2311 length:582 start_codon:yes stop_codon:yes gene_type:complete
MEYTSRAYALLQRGHRLHLKEVVKYLRPRREDKILEIGCARGAVVKALQDIAPETYGIDVNPNAIQHGVTRNLICMSADNMQLAKESFDKIYSFHTIEHILNIKKVLQEIARVLRPGGTVLLVYPAEPIRGLFSIVASFVMFNHPFKARQIHVHKLSPAKIRQLIQGTALEHVESRFAFIKGPEFFTLLRKRV